MEWEEFYAASEELLRRRPLATRCVTKYRHCEGKLVLKVTDDTTCLKFKSDKMDSVKKLEKLQNLFLTIGTQGEGAEISASPRGGGAGGRRGTDARRRRRAVGGAGG